jgi:hypothetical protein
MSDEKANTSASPDKNKNTTSNPVVSDDSDSDDGNIEDELKQ